MNNWKVIFATAVIFGAGVITGGLLVNYVQHCSAAKPGKRAQPVVVAASLIVSAIAPQPNSAVSNMHAELPNP